MNERTASLPIIYKFCWNEFHDADSPRLWSFKDLYSRYLDYCNRRGITQVTDRDKFRSWIGYLGLKDGKSPFTKVKSGREVFYSTKASLIEEAIREFCPGAELNLSLLVLPRKSDEKSSF